MTVEIIPITDRTQWLALRQKDVTASVAGALLGVHDYQTPYSLWALKAGLLEDDPEETAPMKRGRLLEPVALQLLKEQKPDWVIAKGVIGRGEMYLRSPDHRIGCTPDATAYDPARAAAANPKHGALVVIQFKSVEASIFRKKWKDESGTITPPLWIVVQGIVEAWLTGAEYAYVAALVIGFGIELHVIEIPIHKGIIEKLQAQTALFWQKVAEGKAPDPDYARDGEAIASIYAQTNGTTIDLTADNQLPELLLEDKELSAINSANEKRRKAIKAEIISKMGNAEAAHAPGGWLITAATTARKGYTVEPTTYRTVRSKKIEK